MGALNKIEGDGGVIASSQSYSEDYDLKDAVWEFDKELKHIFNSYSQTEDIAQIFFFSKYINHSTYHFLIRSHRGFTKFIERGRLYDRREYFFCDSASQYNTIDFAKSLPEMKQYEKNFNGKEIFPQIEEHIYIPDAQLSKALLSALLNNNTVKIKNTNNAQDVILNALNVFPACYKKYLGFGFNVKDDSFTNANLHVFSTFDDGGVDINMLKQLDNKQWNECAEILLSSEKPYNNDTEILLHNQEITRNTLYQLLDYHKLHYQVDEILKHGASFLEKTKDLQAETGKYVEDFKNYADSRYIQERLTAIIKVWCRQKTLNNDLYKQYQELCNKQNDPEIQKYIEEMINKIDTLAYTSDKLYEHLQNNIFILSSSEIIRIIKKSGLSYLYGKNGLEKLLENNTVLETIVELLKAENLDTQLHWKNKYDKVDKKLSVELKPTDELSKFQAICIPFINHYHEKYKRPITDYVQNSINLNGDREYDFYGTSWQIANRYNFKISLQHKDFFAKGKGKTLFDFYTLFNENNNSIEAADAVLCTIANKYILDELEFPEDKVLPFAYEKDHSEFVKTYKLVFIKRITAMSKGKEYKILKTLLEYFIKEKRNLFLQEENDLYKTLSGVKLEKEEHFNEIYQLGESIEKLENQRLIIKLIDNIINNSNNNMNNNAKPAKMKNFIATATKKWKRRAAGWLVAFCACLLLATGAIVYLLIDNHKHIDGTTIIITHQPEQPQIGRSDIPDNPQITDNQDFITDNLQNIDNRDFIIDSLQNLVDSLSLVPYPNSQLSNKDMKLLYKKSTKADSITINMSIDIIVGIIFKKNPSDIETPYKGKEESYKKLLIKQNEQCFDSSYQLVDSLKTVPCYKKPTH